MAEDESFDACKTAALLASKTHFHLEQVIYCCVLFEFVHLTLLPCLQYHEAMMFALSAGDAFDATAERYTAFSDIDAILLIPNP